MHERVRAWRNLSTFAEEMLAPSVTVLEAVGADELPASLTRLTEAPVWL